MALIPDHIDRRTVIFVATTALACVTGIVSSAITTHLATTALVSTSIFGLAVTASAVNIFAIVTLLAVFGLFLRRVSRRLLLVAFVPGATSYLAGSVLSIITCGITIDSSTTRLFEGSASSTRSLAGVGLASAVIGVIPATTFYALLWHTSKQESLTPTEIPEIRSSPSRSVKRRSITVHLSALAPSSPKFMRSSAPTSPSYSAFSGSPRSSFRNSVTQALRPMTSRTRLLLGTSLVSRDSRSLHSGEPMSEAMRNNDEFENWDTSAVEAAYDTPFASKTKITRLETIPGSRPVSPAHPLNGPFLGDGVPENTPLPASPAQASPIQPPAACMSPVSDTGSPATFNGSTTRRTSSVDQSHIHPLFRTESPAPPPVASPGTVITASPYGGQVFSPDAALGPRLLTSPTGSRPATPNALISPVLSSSGSLRSFRVNSPLPPTTPVDGSEKIMARPWTSSQPQSND